MNKFKLKKNLCALDHCEWQIKSKDEIINQLTDINDEEKHQFTNELLKTSKLIFLENSFDLKAPITMFARAKAGSDAENIALFESLIADDNIRNTFVSNPNRKYTKAELVDLFKYYQYLLPSIMDSRIFSKQNKRYQLTPFMKKVLPIIDDEMKEKSYILSSIAYAHFIKDQVNFDNAVMKDNHNPLPYKYQNYIFSVVPTMSVFQERSRTESLQGFFKDNLMQEFEHRCPICGINIPQMLIASHIRPFRDCAHLIESSDHSNGIILCKNHDFLFDQGYLSFDDEGHIMISDEIDEENYSKYNIKKDFVLPVHLLSTRRKMFLGYHRANLYRKSK